LSVGNAGYSSSLEFTAIKFFYRSFEVRGGLELNKTSLAVSVTASLGVDNVKTRLTCKVFEVLNPESM
jgi:hypothetical protein